MSPGDGERPGYMVPFLEASQLPLMDGVTDIETIDKPWMIAIDAPEGPFAILDAIGINSAFKIVREKANATGDPQLLDLADLLKTEYMDMGTLGRATRQGFYTYPNPSFASPNFLRN